MLDLGAGMDLKDSDILKQWWISGTVEDLGQEWISVVALRGSDGSQGQRWMLGTGLDLSFPCRCPHSNGRPCELSVMRTR